MAEKKVGILIKEARTAARLSQEKLAAAAGENLTGAMISKCERGDIDLTNAQLKKIAVACGVTQASLLNAPKNLSEGKAAAAKKTAAPAKTSAAAKKTAATEKKTAAAKTAATEKKTASAKPGTAAKATTAKKTSSAAKATAAAKTTAAKKTTASKTPSGATSSMKVTASEKKLVEAYRDASSDLKKIALKVLKGEYGDTVTTLLGAATSSGSSTIQDGLTGILGDVLGGILGGK